MLEERYLTGPITEDLEKKMIFLGGPRQVGKTTLARTLVGARFKETAYFNWDHRQQRREMMSGRWPSGAELIILDELHKFKGWKRFIKGEYDTHKDKYKFIVTGSSRLDVYRKGGDSLQGRYHYFRLHPFSVAEMAHAENSVEPFKELALGPARRGEELDLLERFGGFPEPLFSQDARTLRRWHNERNERLFREDIQDVEMIRDLGSMKLLSDMLPTKVGALLSVNNMREDLEVSHRAVSRWLDILEAFYYQFRIRPYARTPFRALKKEPKLYLWDWSEVAEGPARFENLIASHLLKLVHWLHDHEGYKAGLYFLRDSNQKEVDFLVTVDEKPWFAVEVKSQDEEASPALRSFQERLKIPFAYQVLRKKGVDKLVRGVRVVSADSFLGALV
ncbi:MAG: ATP-binding protein [Elusimicrobiota bacterium]